MQLLLLLLRQAAYLGGIQVEPAYLLRNELVLASGRAMLLMLRS